VKLEKYNKLINIEARTCKRMVRQLYLPAIADYAAEVADNIGKVKAVAKDADLSPQENILRKLNEGIKAIDDLLIELDETHHRVRVIADQQECANENASKVVPLMDKLRAEIDALEIVVGADHWPVPSYNDILFYV
jgi:glutamine synthetase